VANLVSRLTTFGDSRIHDIIVVDQSRDSRDFLEGLPGVSAVVEFPIDQAQVDIGGHDHPAALNRLIASYSFTTSHVVVFDSDAFPTARDWLDFVDDVTLAEAPGSNGGLSHPAFMVLPVESLRHLDFAEGFLDRVDDVSRRDFDTGRQILRQMKSAGYEASVSPAVPGFSGFRGDLYLDGRVYHHGHASHTLAPAHLQVFMSQKNEDRWKRKISRSDMTLSPVDYLVLGFSFLRRRLVALVRKSLFPASRGD
jgi:hypothetical protein